MSVPTHNAVLQFKSDTNEIIRFTIPRARLDKTEAEARASMEAMIAGGSIVTGKGRPAAIKSAEIFTTERINLLPN